MKCLSDIYLPYFLFTSLSMREMGCVMEDMWCVIDIWGLKDWTRPRWRSLVRSTMSSSFDCPSLLSLTGSPPITPQPVRFIPRLGQRDNLAATVGHSTWIYCNNPRLKSRKIKKKIQYSHWWPPLPLYDSIFWFLVQFHSKAHVPRTPTIFQCELA